MPWVVFADGLTSEDHFPVLWEDRKDREGYKYSNHGDGSVYTDTPHCESNRMNADNMREICKHGNKIE